MIAIIILVFVLGYLTITLENPLKLDKTVPALMMASVIWALLSIGFHEGWLSLIDENNTVFSLVKGTINKASEHGFSDLLLYQLGETSEILIFLIGAMTIVEIIDLHRGFEVLKELVKTKSKKQLLWIIAILAFFLSSVIDNLTSTIVLITLLRKLVTNKTERMWYAGFIVIAANAGGAWTPIGDVTTTMLWIGKRVSAIHLIKRLSIPSIVNIVVPVLIATFFLPVFKGNLNVANFEAEDKKSEKLLSSKTMLILGISMILFVPIFKYITDLPPYLGMMLGLSVVWLVSEFIHPEDNFTEERRHQYSAHKALSRIEMSSILFFLGILMAVAGLESLVYGSVLVNGQSVSVGVLRYAAEMLSRSIPNQSIVVSLIGVVSSIIDNVPLVAASMGMYNAPLDASVWHLIAYAAGTGGSLLIIGSAAGVAAMGMEKIDFIWYMKKITWLAITGYLTGYLLLLFMEYLRA